MDKRQTRRDLFARLRGLSVAEQLTASASIRLFLGEDPLFQRARTVFSFLSLPGEPDLAPLIDQFPEKRWAFPRVTTEDRICFHFMSHPGETHTGVHGIREPDPLRHPIAAAGEADLFLIPGVGFDPSSGARLGRGKGHYDRYLAAAIEARVHEPAHLTGVAFSTQFVELETEAHDIPMHRMVSERGWE
jgi:5-formyltetrahydrofolate cyclo-ligase